MAEYGDEGDFKPAATLEELVQILAPPRAILLMVKAGSPVDEGIDSLTALLEPGDTIIDGGNSLFHDTRRRATAAARARLGFLCLGASGRAEAALRGAIEDEAEQKGTGRWTRESALELGVPLTGITEAVFARILSSQKGERVKAAGILNGPTADHVHYDRDMGLVDDVRDALYAAKIVAYAQGFEHLQAGSREYEWGLDLGALATIWRGGCIIRAAFLDRIKDAYVEQPGLPNLMLAPFFQEALASGQNAWRRVVKTAVERGVPIPAFSSSLPYYDSTRRARVAAHRVPVTTDDLSIPT